MTRQSVFLSLLTVAVACAGSRPAAAQDWQLTLSPYVWAVSLDGEIEGRGNSFDVDASFGDIWDESDSILAFNSEITLHNGRFGFMVGPNYMNIGFDEVAEGTVLEAEVTTEFLFVDAAAIVRLVDWPMESTTGGDDTGVTMDAYAGVRYSLLDIELDFDQAGSPSSDVDFWDPIIGADTTVDLSERWFVRFRGDVGGFGAGSDFTTMGMAALGFRFGLFGNEAAVVGGYRALFQDYDEDSGAERFEWDMTLHGPTLGLMTRWG